MKAPKREPRELQLLCADVARLTATWASDPIRAQNLQRLCEGDRTAVPYFRNLLTNVVHNSRGIERQEATRLLEFYWGDEVKP